MGPLGQWGHWGNGAIGAMGQLGQWSPPLSLPYFYPTSHRRRGVGHRHGERVRGGRPLAAHRRDLALELGIEPELRRLDRALHQTPRPATAAAIAAIASAAVAAAATADEHELAALEEGVALLGEPLDLARLQPASRLAPEHLD